MQTLLEIFLKKLAQSRNKPFLTLTSRCFAGVSFLYVQLKNGHSQTEWEQFLMDEAKSLIENTVWTFDFRFVRLHGEQLVYRVRFLAPLSKSFCCGNECPDCVLHKEY